MTKIFRLIRALLSLCALCALGCAKMPPPVESLSAAHKRFLEICEKEYQYTPLLYPIQKTLWIYLPMEEGMIEIKTSPDGPQISKEGNSRMTARFVDASFKDNSFHVEYDIAPVKEYKKDFGYQSTYGEEFQKKQNNLLLAIQRAYFDVASEDVPEFIVLVMADVTRGVEIESLLYVLDLKRALANPPDLTGEEYMKRYVTELRGDPSIVGDKKGLHLDYHEIAMGEFLARQMLNRINFKYQQSSFPPSEDTRAEILNIAAETVGAYNFNGFQSVTLHDLNHEPQAPFIVEQAKLSEYKLPEPPAGRFHVIEFFK